MENCYRENGKNCGQMKNSYKLPLHDSMEKKKECHCCEVIHPPKLEGEGHRHAHLAGCPLQGVTPTPQPAWEERFDKWFDTDREPNDKEDYRAFMTSLLKEERTATLREVVDIISNPDIDRAKSIQIIQNKLTSE